MEKELIKIAKEAGKILLENFDNPVSASVLKRKGIIDYSIVVDKKSEDFILESLARAGLEGNVVTEERGYKKIGNDSSYAYYVDPLDGSLNYSKGIRHFCVSIGAEKNKEMVFGIVYDPNHDELFTAKKGEGAFLNGESIKVDKKLEGKVIAIGVDPLRGISKIVDLEVTNYALIKRLWSVALDLCYVACKRLDAMISPHAYPWDFAAGGIIAEEAGAIVTNFQNKNWNVNDKTIIASSSKELHERLLKLVK